jgi:hypothetical protein
MDSRQEPACDSRIVCVYRVEMYFTGRDGRAVVEPECRGLPNVSSRSRARRDMAAGAT